MSDGPSDGPSLSTMRYDLLHVPEIDPWEEVRQIASEIVDAKYEIGARSAQYALEDLKKTFRSWVDGFEAARVGQKTRLETLRRDLSDLENTHKRVTGELERKVENLEAHVSTRQRDISETLDFRIKQINGREDVSHLKQLALEKGLEEVRVETKAVCKKQVLLEKRMDDVFEILEKQKQQEASENSESSASTAVETLMPPAYENQVRRIIDEKVGVLSRSAQINLEEIKDKFREMNTHILGCQNSWDSCAQVYDVNRLYKELGAVSKRSDNVREDIRQLHGTAGKNTKQDGSIFTELAEVRGNFMEVMIEVSDLQCRTEILELRSAGGAAENTRDENNSSSSNIFAASSSPSSVSSPSNLDLLSNTTVSQGEGENNEILSDQGSTTCKTAMGSGQPDYGADYVEGNIADTVVLGRSTPKWFCQLLMAVFFGCFGTFFVLQILRIKEIQESAPREMVFCE